MVRLQLPLPGPYFPFVAYIQDKDSTISFALAHNWTRSPGPALRLLGQAKRDTTTGERLLRRQTCASFH
jgi:hypothetical protein